ncbi:MAG: hypothetical protein HOO96_01265 [Polyangiaceae bacterium]|nr:hypothetical protein [Polyangiaceae bacterium]
MSGESGAARSKSATPKLGNEFHRFTIVQRSNDGLPERATGTHSSAGKLVMVRSNAEVAEYKYAVLPPLAPLVGPPSRTTRRSRASAAVKLPSTVSTSGRSSSAVSPAAASGEE